MPVAPRAAPPRGSQAYARYRAALAGERLPAAFVDLDALEANARRLYARLGPGQTLRVASKSVRCPALLRRVVDLGGARARGVMAYAAAEVAALVEHGFLDVLVAYPTLQARELALVAELDRSPGVRVALVVDGREQVEAAARAARAAGATVPLVVEVDLALRRLGGRVHLGVRRSPLCELDDVVALARDVAARPGVAFAGVMGYEAQVAGLADRNPLAPALDPVRRAIRRASIPEVARRREALAARLRAAGLPPAIFNGGGTGSLAEAAREPWLTELTAGSGFLCSHLFDGYDGLGLEPAAFFALEVVRRPAAGVVTCHGGGYVASGAAGADRLPRPWLPEGLALLAMEGAGEVQTPLRGAAARALALGEPVIFRHAKAGELAEHFASYLLVRGDRVVERAPTYRGLGHAFL